MEQRLLVPRLRITENLCNFFVVALVCLVSRRHTLSIAASGIYSGIEKQQLDALHAAIVGVNVQWRPTFTIWDIGECLRLQQLPLEVKIERVMQGRGAPLVESIDICLGLDKRLCDFQVLLAEISPADNVMKLSLLEVVGEVHQDTMSGKQRAELFHIALPHYIKHVSLRCALRHK